MHNVVAGMLIRGELLLNLVEFGRVGYMLFEELGRAKSAVH
jgi:hypothetical protein